MWILGAALLASIGGNVLLATRAGSDASTGPSPGTAPAPSSPASTPGGAPRSPRVKTAGHAAVLEACTTELSAARHELAAAQATLAQVTSQSARFDEGAPAEAMERRIRPLVEAALGTLPDIEHRDIECRGDLCKVRVSAGTRDEASRGWSALTQDVALKELVDGFSSEAGEPVVDLASGRGGFDIDFYLITRSAADATARLQSLVDDFQASGAIERCAPAGGDRGVLEAKVSVLADEARLASVLGGSLAGTPVGTCISDAFVRELAGFQVPSGTRYGMVYASFVSPHGA